jgi:hypothetical protein
MEFIASWAFVWAFILIGIVVIKWGILLWFNHILPWYNRNFGE